MSDALAMLVPALAMALLHFLWQGALVGLLAWLLLALLRDARPQARYAVACLALLACALLPALSLLQVLSGSGTATTASIALTAGDGSAALQTATGDTLRLLAAPSADALPWVVAFWASGVGLLSLRIGCGLLWVRRLRRQAETDTGDRWQACVDRIAPLLGIHRSVALRLLHAGDSPLTAGWWRPVVLLPMAVAARMPADLVEALIAHELAHVRRHDYLVNLLQGALEALLFYHPVVWWLSHRIRVERELVADDLAAAALGDRRRLALALSALERQRPAPAQSPFPLPHYAPAAHGGHLMSRIQQLVRPERRAAGATLALPLVGLALAGVAFYAHAQLAAPSDAVAHAAPAPAVVAVAQALPVPAASPGAQVLPAPGPATAPVAQATRAAVSVDNDRPGYALVRGDSDGYTMSGDMADREDIRAAQRQIDGDFLWFRRDGKAWVVRDAATVARAREAWAGTEALGKGMQGLEARMKPHAERVEALGARIEELGVHNAFESPEARAAIAKMEAMGERMEPIVERQVALAMRMREASQADQSRLQREQEVLAREQDALQHEMQQHSATLQALSARMQAQHAPMEGLGREMEAASEPMKTIGKEMETLGARIEQQAKLADSQVRQLIDEAYRSGRAQPAPARQ